MGKTQLKPAAKVGSREQPGVLRFSPQAPAARPKGSLCFGGVPGFLSCCLSSSGKANLLSKRNVKKAAAAAELGKSDGASYEGSGSPEDLERNQKIMQWIIEGEKEISRHKKTNHG